MDECLCRPLERSLRAQRVRLAPGPSGSAPRSALLLPAPSLCSQLPSWVGRGLALEPGPPRNHAGHPVAPGKGGDLPPSFLPPSARPRPGALPRRPRAGQWLQGGPRDLSHFWGVNYHCLESELRPSGHNKPCGWVGALSLSQVTAAGPGQSCPHSGGTTSPGYPSLWS